jgi:hypothetical protein
MDLLQDLKFKIVSISVGTIPGYFHVSTEKNYFQAKIESQKTLGKGFHLLSIKHEYEYFIKILKYKINLINLHLDNVKQCTKTNQINQNSNHLKQKI